MRCPCCGAQGVTTMTFYESVVSQAWKVVSLVACVTASIAGQSHLFSEPWQHVISVAGTVAGAIVAWNIKQHPVKDN